MLVREWKCTCPTETATEFIGYLNKTGVKDTQSIDGCCGYKIMRREVSPEVEIIFITLWKTLDQMKIYAGENLYKAVLYPEDYLYKITSDTEVKIYKIVAEGSAT